MRAEVKGSAIYLDSIEWTFFNSYNTLIAAYGRQLDIIFLNKMWRSFSRTTTKQFAYFVQHYTPYCYQGAQTFAEQIKAGKIPVLLLPGEEMKICLNLPM